MCSHVRHPGPVEWTVDMLGCFVILSWWGGGCLQHFGLWTTNWVPEISVHGTERSARKKLDWKLMTYTKRCCC
jgi:hypothetical protein